jgi:hypothetical protein
MKRLIVLSVAVLLSGAVSAATITSSHSGKVYGDSDMPTQGYVAYDAGGAANWNFTPFGGGAASTQGTTDPVGLAVPSAWDENTKWLSDGRCVTYTFAQPVSWFEVWESGGRNTGRALGVAIYNSATNVWIAEGMGGPIAGIPSGGIQGYHVRLSWYAAYAMPATTTKIALWGTGGWLNGLWKKDPSGNPYTGYCAGLEDMDGDGVMDNVLHIGGGQFTDDRNYSMAPEPLTLVLLGGGLLALIRKR